MTFVLAPRVIASGVTSAATLVAGRHYPANSTSGAFTLALPAPARAGESISVEKTDASTNLVTISGSIRGSAATVTLLLQSELVEFTSDATTWWPTGGRLARTTLDARYAATGSGGGGTTTTTGSNVYFMPLWDGTGTQPLRPTDLPDTFVVVWLQPTAPPSGTNYAHSGDRWQTSA